MSEFLGIVIDLEWEEIRISKEKMLEISGELDTWLNLSRATKRLKLSLKLISVHQGRHGDTGSRVRLGLRFY